MLPFDYLFNKQKLLDKISLLSGQNNELETLKEKYHQRCIELENALEKGFSVKVRQEVTEVNVDFSIDELTMMYVSICRYMEKSMSTDDLKLFLTLRIKLEETLAQMKEDRIKHGY